MNLYIETKNGVTKNHPAFEENIIEVFGSIPDHWEPFIRVEKPTLNVYQTLLNEEANYEKVNGVWTDVWNIQEMTAEEKLEKQQAVKDVFSAREQSKNWSAWTFDVATCTMQPPIPRPEPDETKLYEKIFTFWCGAENNWKDTPVRPEGDYRFDFFAWQWVQVTQ
jgi:hypothetical protein